MNYKEVYRMMKFAADTNGGLIRFKDIGGNNPKSYENALRTAQLSHNKTQHTPVYADFNKAKSFWGGHPINFFLRNTYIPKNELAMVTDDQADRFFEVNDDTLNTSSTYRKMGREFLKQMGSNLNQVGFANGRLPTAQERKQAIAASRFAKWFNSLSSQEKDLWFNQAAVMAKNEKPRPRYFYASTQGYA